MDLQDRREYSVSLHGNVYGFCPDCNQDISTAKHYCSGLSRKVDSAESQAEIVALRTRVAELEAQLNEASLLAGHALSVLENGNLPYDRRIASALYVLREPARAALAKEGE